MKTHDLDLNLSPAKIISRQRKRRTRKQTQIHRGRHATHTHTVFIFHKCVVGLSNNDSHKHTLSNELSVADKRTDDDNVTKPLGVHF